MGSLKWMLAGAAIGVIVVAFRDFENDQWIVPPGFGEGEPEVDEREPVLGYDAMDTETVIDWIGDANLDPPALRRIQRYEQAHLGREPVLAAIGDMI